jgi:hypothetical protein
MNINHLAISEALTSYLGYGEKFIRLKIATQYMSALL